MALKETLELVLWKQSYTGLKINTPATFSDIYFFEKQIGFSLPADFVEFYCLCNGFECEEDIFNMTSLADIRQHEDAYGTNWFYFSEYMIYCDMWGLRCTTDGKYEIFNGSYPTVSLTSSLEEFLERFLKGNVFDEGGLYDWHNELKINPTDSLAKLDY